MATVFDNHMTAHVWAQQIQKGGRSHNGNFYFEGQSIYSYGTHFCIGYVLHPAPKQDTPRVYLVNSDSSSKTTNGKHRPATHRATPQRSHSVPSLTHLARLLDSLCYRYAWDEATQEETNGTRAPWLCCGYVQRSLSERRKGLPKVKDALLNDFPALDAARDILSLMGDKTPDVSARQLQARYEKAQAMKKAQEVARKRDQDARAACHSAENTTPQDAARTIRGLLDEAVRHGGSSYGTHRKKEKEDEAKEESRRYLRESKAAKAKGWNRVAQACRDLYNATRTELRRYAANEQRFLSRAKISHAIGIIRGATDRLDAITQRHNRTAQGPRPMDASPEKRAKDFADAMRAIASAWGEVWDSPYARLILPQSTLYAMQEAQGEAVRMRTQYERQQYKAHREQQEENRTQWLAGKDTHGGYVRLIDSEGGALLRAEQVERDDSGAIVSGTLRTSWGATVPLVHAIRAFRFLKLCRTTGKAWKANGKTITVGHFRIDSIDTSGNFKAACHVINWQEVARLAGSLGVLDIAPDQGALSDSARG